MLIDGKIRGKMFSFILHIGTDFQKTADTQLLGVRSMYHMGSMGNFPSLFRMQNSQMHLHAHPKVEEMHSLTML